MSSPPPPPGGRAIVDLVGLEIWNDATPGQRVQLEAYAAENPAGVRRVVLAVQQDVARGRVKAATPVLLSRLARGRHRLGGMGRGDSVLDFCERRYRARRARYPEEEVRLAIEYAVDYTIIDLNASTPYWEVERALQGRIER